MVQVALGLDFLITLWHSEQVKASRLWKVSQSCSLQAGRMDAVSLNLTLSSLPIGCSNSMIVKLH